MLRIARFGFTAVAALVAFAACGARDIAPPQNAMPSGAFAQGVVDRAKSPCSSPGYPWVFHGACKAVKIATKGSTAKLRRYKGVGVDIIFGASSTADAPSIAVADAKGGKDITGHTSFPLYGPATCYPGYSCPGKNIIYIVVDNPNTEAVVITGPTKYVVSAKKVPGKSCTLVGLEPTRSLWIPEPGFTATPKNGKATIAFPDGGLVQAGTVSYAAIACV